MTDITYIQENLILSEIAVRCWSGKFIPKDAGLDVQKNGKSVKDDAAFSFGSVDLISPQRINEFASNRGSLRRELESLGGIFMGNPAYPPKRHAEAKEIINEREKHHKKLLSHLLLNYDDWVKEWADKNPNLKDIILDKKKDVGEVEILYQFKVIPYKVVPTSDSAEELSAFKDAAQSLSDSMYDDIAESCARVLKEIRNKGRDNFNQRIVSSLNKIIERLDGLAFVDPNIRPLVQAIRETMATLPDKGKLAGRDFLTVMGVFTTLSDPKTMRLVGEGKESIKAVAQPQLPELTSTKVVAKEEPMVTEKKIFIPSQNIASPMAQFKL